MNSLKWHVKKKGLGLEYTREEQAKELVRCAEQYAKIHWPKGITVEVYHWPGVPPTINIDDPEKLLTEEQAIEFFEYMQEQFPELVDF